MGIRFYNGPQSRLMDEIYDRLIEHIDVGELDDWPIISLYLARVIRDILDEHKKKILDVINKV